MSLPPKPKPSKTRPAVSAFVDTLFTPLHRHGTVMTLDEDVVEEGCDKYCDYCSKSTDHQFSECPERYCVFCSQFGHIDLRLCIEEPANKQNCEYCNSIGHSVADCMLRQLRTDPSREDLEHATCFACGKVGHLNCAVPLRTAQDAVSCFNCGEIGHVGRDCTVQTLDELIVQQQQLLEKEGSKWEKQWDAEWSSLSQ